MPSPPLHPKTSHLWPGIQVFWSSRRNVTSSWCPCISHYLWTTATFAFVRDNHIEYLWLNPGRISTSSCNWIDELGAICETSLQSPSCSAWGRWYQAAISSSTRTRSPLAWHSCLRSSRRNVTSTWWACICHYLGLRWPVGILEE